MYFSGAPKITNAPNSMRVAEGLNASFVCKASGYPQPTFHWEKKGKTFTNKKSLRYEVISMPHGSVLRIEPIKKRKDSHTFTCVATNEHGEARASAELSVFQRKGIFKKLIRFLEGSWNHEYFGSLAK